MTVRSNTSVQPKRSGNLVATIAPFACIILGYLLWRFVIGADANFTDPDKTGGFWPNHQGPKGNFSRMYEGGIIVPILIGLFLIVITFVVERLLTVSKATGSGNIAEFIRKVQFHLANKDVEKAIAECDRQKGSVGNVMKAGLRKYHEMIGNTELETEHSKRSRRSYSAGTAHAGEKSCIPFYNRLYCHTGRSVRNGIRYDPFVCGTW